MGHCNSAQAAMIRGNCHAFLELYFRGILNHARRLRAGDNPERRGSEGRVRRIEIRPVNEVESFGAKFQRQALRQVELSRQVEVDYEEPRRINQARTRIAKRIWRGRRKDGSVKPRS